MTVHDVGTPDVAAPEVPPSRPVRAPSAPGFRVAQSRPGRRYRTVKRRPPRSLTRYRATRRRPRFKLAYRNTGGTRVIVDLPTGVFGAGPDIRAALQDFAEAATAHLDVLERQPELSDELLSQRDYLRERVRR